LKLRTNQRIREYKINPPATMRTTVRNSDPSPGTVQVLPLARVVTADDTSASSAWNFT
jgi:hypothetical protein